MSASSRNSFPFTATILSLGLLASINACAQREFKGATKAKVIKQDSGDSAARPESPISATPASEPVQDPAVEAVTPAPVVDTVLTSTELEVERVISKLPDSVQNIFKASTTIKDSFQFSLDLKSASTDFKLVDTNAAKNQQHNQITRTAVTDSFAQGSAGSAMSESFEQKGKKGLVDILVVVDNSGSMDAEQKNLASKMSSLLTSLKDTNWQIGVINTSVKQTNGVDDCRLTLMKSTDADASARFSQAVNAGLNGDGNEEGIRQAVNGLKCTQNPWVRPDSSVAVLIVSDEDNCSKDGLDCPNSPGKTENYLINYVEGTLKRTVGENAGFYGIFSSPLKHCSTANNDGVAYLRLMQYKTGANSTKKYGDICDSDYSATLNSISSDIALLLKNQFELAQIPDANTLKLTVDTVAVAAADYTLNGKTITFKAGKEPANGKVLVAKYNVGAIPMFTKVTLKNDPAADTISVKVGSTVLAETAYTVSGREITFKTQPSSLAKISVDYRIAAPLLNTFQLDKTPIAGSLKVLVAGKAAIGMTYDATKNQVVINPAPTDGASVMIDYNYRVGPQLTYRIAVAQGATNIKLYDGAKSLAFTASGDSYTILAADHKVDKVLSLKYDAPDGADRVFTLPHKPDAGSLVFIKDTATCKLNAGITVVDSAITAKCTVAVKSDFLLEYSHTDLVKAFVLEVDETEKGRWEVYVDGALTIDYVRSGNKITLNFDPKLDSLIDIRYTLPE